MTIITWEGEHQGKAIKAELDIQTANIHMGMQRTRLQVMGRAVKIEDIDLTWLRTTVFPDLMAATVSGKVTIDEEEQPWPLSFETFVELPEALGIQWEKTVYEVNPHWLPGVEEDHKKK